MHDYVLPDILRFWSNQSGPKNQSNVLGIHFIVDFAHAHFSKVSQEDFQRRSVVRS